MDRPVPDKELYECTRDELYNRIYTLREDKDTLRAQLDFAMKALERYSEMEQYTYYTVARNALAEIANLGGAK